jgi:cytochrome c peroxidase
MRDFDAEKAFEISRLSKTTKKGLEVKLFGQDEKPIVPLKLNLTAEEKRDLVLFLRALQGDPADHIVEDRSRLPE